MKLTGNIIEYTQSGVMVFFPTNAVDNLLEVGARSVEGHFDDGRTISNDQRRKVYAMIKDLADWSGYSPEEAKEAFKYEFIATSGANWFGLSDCQLTTARDFINFLVEFCVEHGVICRDTLLNVAEDIERYLYVCVLNRKCAICGEKSDIHHTNRVGMGRNREIIAHLGLPVQSLCRRHHDEAHSIGQQTFDEKYHLASIALDKTLCKALKWRTTR